MTDDPEVTVLVVDDDEGLADQYAGWLERAGYATRTAHGGREGVQRLAPCVDVVLLDRWTRGGPCDAVLEAARERDESYQIGTVAAVEPDERIDGLPFDDYLTKPVTEPGLIDGVERLALRDTIDDDLCDLFRLSSKLGTLRTRPDVDNERTRRELEGEIDSLKRRIDGKIGKLEYPAEALSLIDEPGTVS